MKKFLFTLLIVTFLTLIYCLKIAYNQDETIHKQQRRIEVLQGDSIIIHTFFEEQSQKYDKFYNDWINFNYDVYSK